MRAFHRARKERLRFLRSRVAFCNERTTACLPRLTLARWAWVMPLVARRIFLWVLWAATPRFTRILFYTPKFRLIDLRPALVTVEPEAMRRLRAALFFCKRWLPNARPR